ncbi:MAG: hypothetical protein GX237_03395 [Clostridiales bacterium]|nr:hypothetical protein [Clostridiales bacterium]
MNNLKYSLKTLINNPFLIILSLVQFTVIFLFLLIIINFYYMVNSQTKVLEKFFKDKEYYAVQDKTDEDILFEQIFKKEEAPSNLVKFYDFLINNEQFDFIQFVDGNVLIDPKFEINENNSNLFYSQTTPTINNKDKDYSLLKSISVDKNFFQRVGISLEVNLENESQVVLGDKFRDYVKLSEKIFVFDSSINEEVEKEVIGFLDKNTYFYSRSEGLILLDEYIIEFLSLNNIPNEILISHVDNIINNSFVVSEDIETSFALINDKSNELDLYTKLLPLDMKEQSKAILYSIAEYRKIMVPSLICIIIFAFISVTISLLNLIRKNLGEIGVHLSCGATIKDIYIRYLLIDAFLIIIPFLFSMFLSNFILVNILGVSRIYMGVLILLVFILIAFFIGISILPIRYVKGIQLTKILKQEYSL